MIQLGIANRSTVLTDPAVRAFAEAFQVQVSRDFSPIWQVDARVTFVPRHGRLDRSHWWLVFLDDADAAGALGYHETTAAGLPLGKAFARTTLDYGGCPSVTASHEGLEMLGDPLGGSATPPIKAPAGWGIGDKVIQVILEDADACEDDRFAYEIDGVKVSDFVFPAWFNPAAEGSRFDFRGHVKRPLELLPGGYISFRTPDGQWHQVFAQDSPLGRHKHATGPAPGSRLEKLMKPRREWRHSTAESE